MVSCQVPPGGAESKAKTCTHGAPLGGGCSPAACGQGGAPAGGGCFPTASSAAGCQLSLPLEAPPALASVSGASARCLFPGTHDLPSQKNSIACDSPPCMWREPPLRITAQGLREHDRPHLYPSRFWESSSLRVPDPSVLPTGPRGLASWASSRPPLCLLQRRHQRRFSSS